MNIGKIKVRDHGTRRLMTQLLVIERLIREPRSAGFTRLESTLGHGLAVRALAVAQSGGEAR